jgi:hypothetical protein
MSWHFRKSFGSKGFRVNVSQSSVGFSSGVKGFRVSTNSRGTYVNIGSGGVHYRQRIGGAYGAPSHAGRSGAPPSGFPHAVPSENLSTIPSASAHELIDDNSAVILARLNASLKSPSYSWIPALTTVLVAIAVAFWSPPTAIVLALMGSIPVILVHQADVLRKTYPLLYELDPIATRQWDELIASLSKLSNSHRLWRIVAEGAVYDWKRSAGASSTVKRIPVQLQRRTPPFIATNINPFCVRIGLQCLCFMPDRLLIFEAGRWGAVDYSSLQSEVGTTRFIESEGVPSDATVVGSTWRFVNKDGGPDRRFNNNIQIPICAYRVVHLASSQGLNIFLHASSQAFQGFPFTRPTGKAKTTQSVPPKPPPSNSGSTGSQAPKQQPAPACYATLGLSLNCSQDEAQAAYRSLAKNYHPDLVAHMASEFRTLAEDRMKEINAAYTELRRVRGW